MIHFFAIAPLPIVLLPLVLLTNGSVKTILLGLQVGLLLLQISCAIIYWKS